MTTQFIESGSTRDPRDMRNNVIALPLDRLGSNSLENNSSFFTSFNGEYSPTLVLHEHFVARASM